MLLEGNPYLSRAQTHSFYNVLTVDIHPYIQTPYFMIHPCRTADLLKWNMKSNNTNNTTNEVHNDEDNDNSDSNSSDYVDVEEEDRLEQLGKEATTVYKVPSSETCTSNVGSAQRNTALQINTTKPTTLPQHESNPFFLWVSLFLPLLRIKIPQDLYLIYSNKKN